MLRIVFASIIGLALIVWLAVGRDAQPHAVSPGANEEVGTLPSISVLKIRPGNSATPKRGRSEQVGLKLPHASPNIEQLRAGRDLATLYARVASESTPEALYIQAQILSRCAFRGDKSPQAKEAERLVRREKFVAGLDLLLPKDQKRLAAFDKVTVDPCVGLELPPFDATLIKNKVERAAAEGDTRASALLLSRRIEADATERRRSGGGPGYVVSPEDFRAALQLLQNRDADVVTDLGKIISSTMANAALSFDGERIDSQAMHSAWMLAACELGAACGADSLELLGPCAFESRCDAGDLSDRVFYYDASPHRAQLIDQYRAGIFRMMETGDWSRLTYSPRQHPTGTVILFGTGRWP